ncbi:MAG: RagB/SusD family nutrient uptake outer membrane protein [Bacteroidales bacterium]|nr:RagB/SusD family nutrient uptake outer membrane protein [Bacteroidales bacterium]
MKKYLMIIAAAALAFASCDMLDKKPLSEMSPESYFKTEQDLQLFSNTFYNNLLPKSPYGYQSDHYVKQTMSDELHGGSYRIVPESGSGWSWGDLRKMNTLLSYIDNCEDEEAIVEYTALTKFFRTFFYFEKVKRFGDVPWIDVELGSADEALFNPRDNREVVMQHMLEDINYAIENLPAPTSQFRVNKYTALALKAQFCLFEGTFRKYHAGESTLKTLPADAASAEFYLREAADAAKQIMDSGKYSLYTTGKPNQDYRDLFVQENCEGINEFIFAIKFDYGLAIFHNSTAYGIASSQGRIGATRKFIDSYLMKDGTRFTDKPGYESLEFAAQVADRDPRLAQSFRTIGYTRIDGTDILAPDLNASCTGYQTIKWVMSCKANGGDSDRVDRSTSDLPVYRLGEILLIYAEAKAELGELTQEDLNVSINLLRKRVGMPSLTMDVTADPYLTSATTGYTNSKLAANSQYALILEIRRERAIELAQEANNRWYDLVRWREGKCVDQPFYGLYFPGPGEYDINGDGKLDYCLYEGDVKPDSKATSILKIGSEILLSNGKSGYVEPHKGETHSFNESRDYYYPIPINERSLNPNLTQNDGWDDGLDF